MMRSISAVLLSGLAAVAWTPLAAADEGDGYFSCQKPVTQVAQDFLDDSTEFLEQLQRDSVEFAGKMKCTAFETAMVCSEEEVAPREFPQTTGSAHPHRDRCYEYMILSNACPPGTKRERYIGHDGSGDEVERTRCVPLYCGFVADPFVSTCPERARF